MFDTKVIERHHTNYSKPRSEPGDPSVTPRFLGDAPASAYAHLGATLAAETDIDALTPQENESEFLLLTAAIDRLKIEAARRLRSIDQTRPYSADGYSSTTAYVVHQTRTTGSKARRQVADARSLGEMPHTTELATAGALSEDQVRTLINAYEELPDQFGDAEEMLCEIASQLSSSTDFRRAVRYWQEAASEPPTSRDEQADAEYLHVSRTLFGMVKLDGLLTPENGNIVIEALTEATPPPSPDDTRTAGQRRAMALTDLAAGSRGSPRRPSITVHVDFATFSGVRSDNTQTIPTLHETGSGDVLTCEAVDKLTCYADVRRVVFGPNSELLDVGRQRRLVSEPMRQAIVARDRHCTFPGCFRPPQWTDAHHIEHYRNGGATSAENLVLLCRFHHTAVHERGFKIRGPAHDPRFFRPNGTELSQRPWLARDG